MMRSFLKNLFLACLSLILTLALGVFVIDFYHLKIKKTRYEHAWHDPNTQFDVELGWVPIPNRDVAYAEGTISSNSHGFRSAEIDPEKKQIVVLGDSVAWGYGVSDDQTFPYALDFLLEPLGRQVSNLAVSGYGIGQHYLYFKKHSGKFNQLERVILVLFPDNDFEETRSNFTQGKRKPLFKIRDGKLKLTHTTISQYCPRNILSLSRTMRTLAEKYPAVGKVLGILAGDEQVSEDEARQVIALLLEKIEGLAKAHGAKLTIVLSPSRNDLYKRSSAFLWFEDFLEGRNYDFLNYYEYMLKKGNRNLPGIVRLFLDNGHYHPAGNYLLADCLFDRYWMKESEPGYRKPEAPKQFR